MPAWEQRKLGELADIVGGGTPDTNNEKYWGGDIDWYSPAELDSSIYVEKSLRRITDEGLLSCAARMLPANKTILFTSRAGIGNTAILRRSACTNQGFQSLVVQDGTDVYFIYSMSSKIKKWAEAKASGSTFLEISGRQLGTMQIAVPSSHEQRQIGQLFSRLDALITLHQRKYDKLGELKKSLLEKMFPKEGEVFPEIRFAGFADPWEQRKLGELADSFEYGLNVPASDFDGIHKYLRITDIDDETHRFNESDLTSPLTDLMKCEQYRLAEGDLLFARTGASVGKTYLYQSSDGLAYYAGFLIRAHIHDDASADFVFQSTLTERYRRFVSITSQRSGQPGINAKEYSEYEVPTPSLSEQRLIGRLFSRLDALITLHQRKLELLRNIKKALLDKMFVEGE